ncbi:hypothetical protein HQ47_04460 [Porphyromonas macacae]|uniref:Fibronectin type-III domain-containing protein n=1 Tax=Porphyromonas macacae TaxID=28115 RepID=A0A0A2E5Y5_9PORP|nr:hypothetical protein [Porphyromonas macacae]KGN74318.1 hypothetical protein HQ47_04460 [Porphyromonas macacae]
MMKKIVLALVLGCLLIPKNLLAQEDKNLWYNPGFEIKGDYFGEETFHRWVLKGAPITKFNFETENPHGGKYCLKLFPTDKVFLSLLDKDEDLGERYSIKAGETLTLSYWHRGDLDVQAMEVFIKVYNETEKFEPILEKKLPGSKVITSKEWAKKVISITVNQEDLPENKRTEKISFIEIKFEVPFVFNSKKIIYVDDFSLIRGGEKPGTELEEPKTINTKAYEREIELSWDEVTDKDITWEVVANGNTYPTNKPTYLLHTLEPSKEYTVKVCAVKGKDKSKYKEVKVRTSSIFKEDNDITRVPYLRTLNAFDNAPQTLNLFYSDLYNASAKFTYWIDGVKVTPEGYQLKFPKKGKQELKVRIEESTDKVWTLTYNLDVI